MCKPNNAHEQMQRVLPLHVHINAGKGPVRACAMMPMKAQQRTMCSGTPTSISWNTALTAKTSVPARQQQHSTHRA